MAIPNRKSIRTGISFGFELSGKPRKNGEYNILFRVTENRKHKRIATEVNVRKDHWDKQKEVIKKGDQYHTRKNLTLSATLNKAQSLQHEFTDLSLDKAVRILRGEKSFSKSVCLFDYAVQHYVKDKPFNTTRNTTTITNKLREFTGKQQLLFEDINSDFLQRFENYLRIECKNSGNTVDTNLSKIKAIINHAIRSGTIPLDQDPFRMYRIKECLPVIERLDEAEVNMFANVQFKQNDLPWNVQNYWLFSFYSAGIRFCDIACLRWGDIEYDSSGRAHVKYRMHKTRKMHGVPLPEQATRILGYYYKAENAVANGLVFPILNPNTNLDNESDLKKEISRKNALVNKYLKVVGKAAGITKSITFHMSRHSYANIARKKTNDVYAISKALSHSKLATTERYFARIDSDAVCSVQDAMFGPGN